MQPLAYLWQQNQSYLLQAMIDAKLEAVLIKVAGIGLTEKHLGQSLAQMQPRLEQLHAQYGAHVCGEGGEYETLAVDSPLFVHRVVLAKTERVLHADAAFASVSYLRILVTGTEAKNPRTYGLDAVQRHVRKPPLLDPLGVQSEEEARAALAAGTDAATHPPPGAHAPTYAAAYRPALAVHVAAPWIAVGNVTGDTSGSFHDEVTAALAALVTALHEHGYDAAEISHVNVYLSSQSLFPALNAVYRTVFGTSPPSRASVALPLGDGVRVMLDAVAYHDTAPPRKRVLHVQSRSYWAPANIGPYAQAVLTDDRIWIAGQIGMVPASLDVPADVATQIALALQHARRIVLATREWSYAAHEGHVEGGVCWIASDRPAAMADAVHAVWTSTPADDLAHAHQQGDDAAWLGERRTSPPLLVLQLAPDALPKHAAVEWQLTANTGRTRRAPEDEDTYALAEVAVGVLVHNGVRCAYRVSCTPTSVWGIATLAATDADDGGDAAVLAFLRDARFVRLAHAASATASSATALLTALCGRAATTSLPVLGWCLAGEPLSCAADAAAITFV